MSDALVPALDRLVTRLEALISCLSAGAHDAAATGTSWSSCDEAFAHVRALLDAKDGEPVPPEARERVDQVQRLQAVATGLTRRAGDLALEDLTNLAGARRLMQHLQAVGGAKTGGACDMTG